MNHADYILSFILMLICMHFIYLYYFLTFVINAHQSVNSEYKYITNNYTIYNYTFYKNNNYSNI